MSSIEIQLPYGNEQLKGALQGVSFLGTLEVKNAPAIENINTYFRDALKNPTGQTKPFKDTLQPGDSVCIVVSDSFRYTGIELLLPDLLGCLTSAGIDESQICFLFATGSHRGPTSEEAERILGIEVYARFKDRAYTHDPADTANLLHLGTTSRGTPVEINRRAVECDHLIVTGSVVYHYFGGFGGGRKAILPGIASLNSIAANHSLNIDPVENRRNPEVRIGRQVGNPVAEDMLEGALFCKTALLINTVLNRKGEISGLFVGDLQAAHEAACAFAVSLYGVPISQQADLVIASAGSAKNFVQSHKSMFNGFSALKPGGRLVLAAEAPEGLGGERFRYWLGLKSVDAVFKELRRQAEINGQTALSVLEKAPSTILITRLPKEDVACIGAKSADNLQSAIEQALGDLQGQGITQPSVYVMPSAGFTVPLLD